MSSSSNSANVKSPAFDPELEAARKAFPIVAPFDEAMIVEMNKALASFSTAETAFGADPEISHEEHTVKGHDGYEIKLAVVRRKPQSDSTNSEIANAAKGKPAIYFIHGGGYCIGNRFGCPDAIPWIKALDVVFISVEYRLVPEHPYPAPLEDCYAGLRYVGENSASLGIDPEKIVIAGLSAGGGLTAGLGLLVRERGGVKVLAQLLMCPMLDDRMESESCKQLYEIATWKGVHNKVAWGWYLNGRKGEASEKDADVSIFSAPGRATDLSGLPTTWIDVGEADLYRDEDVKYASRIWEAGGSCELHVWKGAWHGFEIYGQGTAVVKSCDQARLNWLTRVLA